MCSLIVMIPMFGFMFALFLSLFLSCQYEINKIVVKNKQNNGQDPAIGIEESLRILKHKIGILERESAERLDNEIDIDEGLESLRILEWRIGLLEKDRARKLDNKLNIEEGSGSKSVELRKRREVFVNNFNFNSTTLNVFVETNDEQIPQGKQFYKTFGAFGSPALFEYVKKLPEHKRKRILVTGGAGFVGSHLVDSLMLDGHEVIVCDNFFTGRKSNVEHWQGHSNFELINHDIINPLTIEVNQIYHLASPASPQHYMYNPIKTIKTNTIGTINILGLAKRVGARVLIASTSEVYGDPQEHPQAESYWGHVNPVGPRSCYDESKRLSESLAMAYNGRENVSIGIARIFNTYGPRMHPNDGRVVSNFVIQALSNEPLTVYGTGKQTRSFQYISDLVSGMKKLMESNVTTPVNLGNPDEMSVESLALGVAKSVPNFNNRIVFDKLPVDDPQRRKPDISKAKLLLDWKPNVPLQYGLRRTIDYFMQELHTI